MNKSDPAKFERQIDRWSQRALARHPNLDFDDLVGTLPGVYPADLWASVLRLGSTGDISVETFQHLQHTKDQPKSADGIESPCPLPLPHPLDFDWRFADATVQYLMTKCLALTQTDDIVGFLGTPRLAIRAAAALFDRRFRFLDRNPAAVAAVSRQGHANDAIVFDAGTDPVPLPDSAAAICIDPPWYLPQSRSFMWVASSLCRRGGHVLLSVPAIGTRPGMAAEWREMRAWALCCGLSLVGYERSSLVYVSPPFERNALRADGFRGVNTHWRRADLALFVRNGQVTVARPAPPPTLSLWHEVVISNIAFRVRPEDKSNLNTSFQDPRLYSLLDGDVLASVSTRDPRRASVNVWTTGNRVFKCHGTSILRPILDSIAAREAPPLARIARFVGQTLRHQETTQVCEAMQQIEKLVTIERNEQINGFHGFPYGMATPDAG